MNFKSNTDSNKRLQSCLFLNLPFFGSSLNIDFTQKYRDERNMLTL